MRFPPGSVVGLSITRSVASWEGDIDAEPSGYLATQTSDGETVLDKLAYPSNGLLVGPQIFRGQLISIDAIRPIG
jgi:hypothetical protein